MDVVGIALSLLIRNPDLAVNLAERATAPGTVNVAQMQTSVADLARGVLHCYHRTARFHATDVAHAPWARQAQYGAENSAVLRIHYSGVSGARYHMVVAVMAKERMVRTAVLADAAKIPYSKGCQLEEWTGA
jgi:hypothetical protein